MISDSYLAQQRQMHEEKPEYGCSGQLYAAFALTVARQRECASVLDYGCGKGTFRETWEALAQPGEPKVAEYDPAIPGRSALPSPADLVVCTDVLEHVEPAHLDAVLRHLRALTCRVAFLAVHTGAAIKRLPDGRNAHLIQQSAEWWLPQFWDHDFRLTYFQETGRGFAAVVV